MPRILLCTVLAVAIQSPAIVQGQSNVSFRELPISETFTFSVELVNQVGALESDVLRLIRDRDDRRDVLNQLQELYEEIDDLNEALENAARTPSLWNRVRKEAEDVDQQLLQLSTEVDQAVEQMNRFRRSQRASVPTGPSHYRSVRRSPGRNSLGRQTSFQMSFRRTNGRLTLVKSDARPSQAATTGLPPADVFPPIPRGTELTNRVNYMQAVSGFIQIYAY